MTGVVLVVVAGVLAVLVAAWVLVPRWLRTHPDPAWRACGFRYTSDDHRRVD